MSPDWFDWFTSKQIVSTVSPAISAERSGSRVVAGREVGIGQGVMVGESVGVGESVCVGVWVVVDDAAGVGVLVTVTEPAKVAVDSMIVSGSEDDEQAAAPMISMQMIRR